MHRQNQIHLGIKVVASIVACFVIYSLWDYIVASLALVGAYSVCRQYQRIKDNNLR
jgi:hypothetical protein